MYIKKKISVVSFSPDTQNIVGYAIGGTEAPFIIQGLVKKFDFPEFMTRKKVYQQSIFLSCFT
jgi:hypothetical protein